MSSIKKNTKIIAQAYNVQNYAEKNLENSTYPDVSDRRTKKKLQKLTKNSNTELLNKKTAKNRKHTNGHKMQTALCIFSFPGACTPVKKQAPVLFSVCEIQMESAIPPTCLRTRKDG